MASNDQLSLDSILNLITTTTHLPTLNHSIRNVLPRESRELILASTLSGGSDPLSVLDMSANTLGVLYILSARLGVPTAQPPEWTIIRDFCHNFIPEHARIAPDRVTMLAKGIKNLAVRENNLKLAIEPLYGLVQRYPYDPSYLTTIHQIFIMTCVTTRHFSAAIPVLSHPITNIDTNLSDLHYNDNLTYHYAGGIALAALEKWDEALECFEICATSPGTHPSAVQMEALKKLSLIQLIGHGKTTPLPKYTNSMLTRLFKSTPYNAFINSYPQNMDQLQRIADEARHLFATDKNIGLIQQAIRRAPRWLLQHLTATYLTLSLVDIGRVVRIESEDKVRQLLLSMIESGDINAQISSDCTVTFFDPVPRTNATKSEIDRMLRDVQQHTAILGKMDVDMERSREFLSKVVKARDDTTWPLTVDEDAFPAATWDEAVFS